MISSNTGAELEMLFKVFMAIGGLSGCAGVVLGALTAHAFKHRLDTIALASLETVSNYLLIHGLLLVLVASLAQSSPSSVALKLAGSLIIIGIILFCGGLSASLLSGIRTFSAGAPVGGMAFMSAWLLLCIHAWSRV